MLKNYSSVDIKKDNRLSNSFLNSSIKDLDLSCNIFKGNFYLDSFNYFVIIF